MSLSKLELSLIARILKETSSEYSCHGCNDFTLKNSKENKEFLITLAKDSFGKEDLEEEIESIKNNKDKELYTYDWLLMQYLSNRCKEESK